MFDFWKKRDKSGNIDDEFGDFDNFDFDDFGFDSEPVKDDRSPITKAADGVTSGLIGSFKNAEIDTSIQKALPDNYKEVFDVKNQIQDSYKDIVDHVTKEFEPIKGDLKKIGEKVIKGSEKFLPEKVYQKLSDLVKTDSFIQEQQDKEARERAQLQAELAGIFDIQNKAQEEREERREKKEEFRSMVSHQQHQDTFSQLDAIRRASITVAEYHDNILLKYQRKDLENTLKQTNILLRIASETSALRAESKSALDIISKNTGLPDYVKQLGSERLKATATQRFYDRTIDNVFHGKNFVGNFLKETREGAKGWFSNFISSFASAVNMGSDMVGQLDDMEEMTSGMEGMPQLSKIELAGNMAGSYAGNWLKDKTLGQVREFITGKKSFFGKQFPWADKVNKGGWDSQIFLSNLPYHLQSFIRKQSGSFNPLMSYGVDILDSLLTRSTSMANKSLSVNTLSQLHEPAQFTNKVSRSIAEVIPGYLSKILREVTILRTGDTNTPELLFDFQTNGFKTKRDIAKTFLDSVISDRRIESFGKYSTYAMEDIDTNKTLKPEDYKQISHILSSSIGRRDIRFDKNYLTDPKTYMDMGFDKANKISELMTAYLKGDDGEKVKRLIDTYGGMVSMEDNVAGRSQMMYDAGYQDILRNIGFTNDRHVIDNSYLYDLVTGKSDKKDLLDKIGEETTLPNSKKLGKGKTKVIENYSTIPFSPEMRALDEKRNNYLDAIFKQIQKCCDKKKDKSSIDHLVSSLDKTTKEILKALGELQITQMITNNTISSADIGKYIQAQLNAIHARLDNSGNSYFGKVITAPFKAAKWTIEKASKLTWGGVKLGVKGGFESTKLAFKGTKFGGWLAGKVADTGLFGINKITNEIRSKVAAVDVYLKDQGIPILRAHLMRAGEYFNKDGTVIKKLKDIKGDVYDKAGNLILTAEEFKDAHLGNIREGIVAKISDIIGDVSSLAREGAGRLMGTYGIMAKMGWQATLWTKNKLFGQNKDVPADVYIKGVDRPILTRIGMLRDHYIDENTASFVNKVSDITGPVIDTDGNYLLTEAELKQGLYDKEGRPFGGLLNKSINYLKNKGKQALNWTMDKLRQGKETLSSWFSKDNLNQLKEKTKNAINVVTPDIFISSNKEIVSVLNKIYTVLDNRLPGKRKLGDRDSDGDVDNSVSDIMQRRKEELLSKAKEKASTDKVDPDKVDKDRPKGVFGLIWDMLKRAGTMVAGIIGGGLLAAGSAVGSGISNALTAGIGGLAGLLGLKGLSKGVGKAASTAGSILSKIGKFAKGGVKGAIAYMLGSNILGNLEKENYVAAGLQTVATGALAKSAFKDIGKGFGIAGSEAAKVSSTTSKLGSALTGTLKGAGMLGTGAAHTLGFLGKAANFMTAGLAGKILSKGAAKAFVPIDLLMSGYNFYQGHKTGNLNDQIESGSSLGGTGMGAAIGTFLGGPVGALAGAAIGGIVGWLGGMATNAIRKYRKKGKLSPMEEIRFVQYGFNPFDPVDKKKIDKVLTMELIIQNALVENGNKWILDPGKIDSQALLEVTGISPHDERRLMVLQEYIHTRFAPVVIAWVMALRALHPNKLLEYADRIDDIDKVKIVTAIKALPDSTYSFTEGFFPDHIPLVMTSQAVRRYLEKKESDLKDKYIKDTMDDKDSFWSRPWFESKEDFSKRKQKEREEIQKSLQISENKALSVISENIVGASIDNVVNKEIIAAADFDKDGYITPDGKIKLDAVSAIRFIAYGLKDFSDIGKISQLRKLEDRVSTKVTFKEEGIASFTMDSKAIIAFADNQMAMFGSNNRKDIRKWMSRRFLPVYLKFRALVNKLGIKVIDVSRIKLLNPQQKLLLGQGILDAIDTHRDITTGIDKGDSVFTVKESPWPDYTLSEDATYARPYLNYLEYQAEKGSKVDEEKLDKKPDNNFSINKIADKSGFMQTSLSYKGSDGREYRYNSYGERIPVDGQYNTYTSSYTSSYSDSDSNVYTGNTYTASSMSSLDRLNSIGGGTDTPSPGSEIPSPRVIGKTGNAALDEAMNAKLYAIGEVKGKMRYGSDNKILNAFIGVESMGVSDVTNDFGYVGLGQFKKPAWDDAKRYVPGLLPWSEKIAKDPGQGFAAIKGFMLANANYVKKSGIDMSDPVNLYLAHQQGAGGLMEIHKGMSTGQVSSKLRRNMDNNGMRGGTPTQFYKYWQDRFYKNYESFANIGGTKYEKSTSQTADPFADMVVESQSSSMGISPQETDSGFTPVSMNTIPTGSSYFQSTSSLPNTPVTGYGNSIANNNVITDIVSSNGKDQPHSVKQEAMSGSDKAKKAALYASKKALKASSGYCARYVANALEYAGYRFTRQESAYLYNTQVLPQLGFSKIPLDTPYQIGDIIVYGQGKSGQHPHGHIQIFDGSNWISDFRQKSIMIYKNPKNAGKMTLWRDMGYQSSMEEDTPVTSEDTNTSMDTPVENPVAISSQGDMVTSNDYAIQDARMSQHMRQFEHRPTVTTNPVGDRYDRATVAQMREAENNRQIALIGEGLNVAKEHLTVSKEQLKVMMSIYQYLKDNPNQQTSPAAYQEPKEFVAENSPSPANTVRQISEILPVALGVKKARV